MKLSFVALIILILAVYAYLRFQPDKGVKTSVLPAETLPVAPIPTNNFDQLTEEQKRMMLEFEAGMKRTRVYAGDLKVPPPCPEDTHEENGFCRKGSSKYDTDIPAFIGAKTLEIDASCRPDQCDTQCKKACEDTAGEVCTLFEDISQECLKDHPPEKQAEGPEELREQGIQCRALHQEYKKRYRCAFSTSEHEQFRYTRSATDEECREMYINYQKCLKSIPRKKDGLGKILPPSEAEMRCTLILNDDFAPARCEVAWNETDGLIYGRSKVDKVVCNYVCH